MILHLVDDVEGVDAVTKASAHPSGDGAQEAGLTVLQGSKVEVWNEARWEAQVSQALTFSDEALPPELEGFTL